MATKRKIRKAALLANIKKNLSSQELKQDAWTLLAPAIYILPATLLGLSGWGGFVTSFGLTFFTGALLDKPAICRAAWAIGATQLTYTLLTGTIEKTFKKPVWRMGTAANMATPVNGMNGLANYMLQPKTQNISLPHAGNVAARRAPELESAGVSDYMFNGNENSSRIGSFDITETAEKERFGAFSVGSDF